MVRQTSRASWLSAVLSAALGVGCTSPGSQRIVGPDGSAMAHVHCGSDQGACFRLAGELCPTGYELKPALAGYHGNFLVRCRAPQPIAAVAAPCAPPSQVAPLRSEAWPPSSEPWPASYPWAPPRASATVQAPPTAGAATTPVEIDLGY